MVRSRLRMVSEINYNVNLDRKESFIREISKYWGNFDLNKLAPDYELSKLK